jgi:hypothetical protein
MNRTISRLASALAIATILLTALVLAAKAQPTMGSKGTGTAFKVQTDTAIKVASQDSRLRHAIMQGDADAAKALLVRDGAPKDLMIAVPRSVRYNFSVGFAHPSGFENAMCQENGEHPIYGWVFYNNVLVLVIVGCGAVTA